jgi:hypothetical protein
MNPNAILLPVIALAALTFIVLACVPYRRFKAAFALKVTAEDFSCGESANVPAEVSIPNRNLMNLLETPVLFYVICLAFCVTRSVDGIAMCLAWIYVASRGLHSLIHLTYNRVTHRLAVFAVGILVLIALWVRLFLTLAG